MEKVLKFSVEYRRTVQVAPYESLSIGILEEFDKKEISHLEAFESVKNQVDYWIETKRKQLREPLNAKPRLQ